LSLQATPEPTPIPGGGPTPPSIHIPSAEDIANSFIDGLLGLLGDFLHNGVQAAQGLLRAITDSPANIYTRTPPELTYAHPAVVEMFGHMRLIGLGALALLIVIAGFTHMAGPHLGSDVPLRTLAVRAAFAVTAGTTTLFWSALLIDLVNALNAAILSVPLGTLLLPWPSGFDPIQMAAALLYAIVLLWLFFKFAIRVVWLLILLAIAPPALMLYTVPQLAFVSAAWGRQFFGNLFGQPLTLAVLRLGSAVLVGHGTSAWDYFVGAAVAVVALQMPSWFVWLALGSRHGGQVAVLSPARELPALGGAGVAARVAVGGAARRVAVGPVTRGGLPG
jgi:hypothetical protein